MEAQATETGLIRVVDGQIVQGTEYQIELANLSEQARGIVEVTSPEQYARAAELCAKAKSIVKSIEASAEPERLKLQGILAKLRTQRDLMANCFTEVVAPLERMATEWKAAERRAAQAEQEKLSKKNGQPVTVKPNVPAVAGARAHVNYSAQLLPDGRDQILTAYVHALSRKAMSKSRGDKQEWLSRANYLLQFVTIDMQAVNAEARRVKNAKQLDELIPGVRGIETDRI